MDLRKNSNTSLHSSNLFTDRISFFGLCTASKLKKPVLLPYPGKEAPNLVDTLDRAILSHWAPQKHSTYSDTGLRDAVCFVTQTTDEVPAKEIVSVSYTPPSEP